MPAGWECARPRLRLQVRRRPGLRVGVHGCRQPLRRRVSSGSCSTRRPGPTVDDLASAYAKLPGLRSRSTSAMSPSTGSTGSRSRCTSSQTTARMQCLGDGFGIFQDDTVMPRAMSLRTSWSQAPQQQNQTVDPRRGRHPARDPSREDPRTSRPRTGSDLDGILSTIQIG